MFPALAFSPDGATLASVADRSLVLWDLASKEELMRLGGHKESITGVAFSPDGALVATTCGDHMTRIWDARDGRALAVLPGPWFMRSLAFSPDGGYLAASADPGPVCLYELKGWRRATTLDRPQIRRPVPGLPSSFGSVCLRGRRLRHHRLGREPGPSFGSMATLQNLGLGAGLQPRRLYAGEHVRKFRRVRLCERPLGSPVERRRWLAPQAFAPPS